MVLIDQWLSVMGVLRSQIDRLLTKTGRFRLAWESGEGEKRKKMKEKKTGSTEKKKREEISEVEKIK